MNLELLRAASFWMLVIGLALEVVVAIVAFVITHKEISKENEKTLKHWLEACAVLAGLLVLLAIIGEHKIGKMDAKEKREANERIKKLEAATRPKPFDERLRMFLNRKDPNILIGLRNGTNRFAGSFSQSELGELKALMDEPEAAQFIRVKFDGVATLLGSGIMSGASFELSTDLLTGR